MIDVDATVVLTALGAFLLGRSTAAHGLLRRLIGERDREKRRANMRAALVKMDEVDAFVEQHRTGVVLFAAARGYAPAAFVLILAGVWP